ncbi:MAG: hypothetical protein ACREE5_07695 [Acetobacteraceae bacterium]
MLPRTGTGVAASTYPRYAISGSVARSQFIGGMTMSLARALYEESVLAPRLEQVVNNDFANDHTAADEDVLDLEAIWLDETDPHPNPMGLRGIGEIGSVGAAAAIATAVWHAAGIRVRELPITPDKRLDWSGSGRQGRAFSVRLQTL